MSTLKEQLLAGFVERREELVRLSHPALPHLEVVAATIVDSEQIRRLSAQSDKQKKPAWWLNAVLVAEQTRRIYVNGDALVDDDDGEYATWRTQGVLDFFGAATVAECVRAAYGSDIYLSKVAESLMEHSGFGDEVEVEPVDPTRAG